MIERAGFAGAFFVVFSRKAAFVRVFCMFPNTSIGSDAGSWGLPVPGCDLWLFIF